MRRQPQGNTYTKWERRGSAVAHGATLLVGVPTRFLLLDMPFALALCPVVAYLIARSFRRHQSVWGAFQGMQATVVQLFIFLLAALATWMGPAPTFPANLLWTAAFLLFLYSLWGAVDTALGYDFRYLFIGRWLDRVSQANLQRRERRRGWFRPSSREDEDDRKPPSA